MPSNGPRLVEITGSKARVEDYLSGHPPLVLNGRKTAQRRLLAGIFGIHDWGRDW